MINNKYGIWDRVWYILDWEIRSYEVGEFIVRKTGILYTNWNNEACCSYEIDSEEDLFPSEEEAKQELKKQLQDKINKL